MLAMIGGASVRRKGILSAANESTPTFSSPMALSIPQAVSTMRGGGLPFTGLSARPFTTMAPRRLRSINDSNSRA